MNAGRIAVATSAIAITITLALAGCAPDPPSAIVGIEVAGCRPGIERGSGQLVAPGIVLTAAHVVAGADPIMVTRPGGAAVPGRTVGFDPNNDLAYLAIDPIGQELKITTQPTPKGATGTAYVVRAGEIVALPVVITRPVVINTEDVYLEEPTSRPGFEISADLVPGDSGGAVVVDGVVVGVIWARSSTTAARAYAIDVRIGSDLIDAQLAAGAITTDEDGTPIDLTRCDCPGRCPITTRPPA